MANRPANLPPRCYEVCLLRLEGMPQEDIADIVGITQPTVSRHLSLALERYPILARLLLNRRGRPRKSA